MCTLSHSRPTYKKCGERRLKRRNRADVVPLFGCSQSLASSRRSSRCRTATMSRKSIDNATDDFTDTFHLRYTSLLPPPRSASVAYPPTKTTSSSSFNKSSHHLPCSTTSRRCINETHPSTTPFHAFSRRIIPLKTQTTDQLDSITRLSPIDVPKGVPPSDAWRTPKAVNLPKETIDRFLSSV